MKIITVLAVLAMLSQAHFGTTSSVGGPMTMMLIVFIAALAVGIQQAAVNARGPLGLFVSIVAAIIGGAVGVVFASMVLEVVRDIAHVEGSLAKSHHPLLYVLSAAMAIFTVTGSWLALQIVDRAAKRFKRSSQA